MSDKKFRVRPLINSQWLTEEVSRLKQWVLVLAGSTLPETDPKPVVENHLGEIGSEFAGSWSKFESDHCRPLGEAIDQVTLDMGTFDATALTEEAETQISDAEAKLREDLAKECAEKVAYDQGRIHELRSSQTELAEKTEQMRLQKIRTCGDEDAPIDPLAGLSAIIKAVSEILMIGLAIAIEVMIGIKAQQHGSNLVLAVGITAAALLLMFTTAHYGMTSLKRIIGFGDSRRVFNEKYRMHDDGRHYDRYSRLVELAWLDSSDRFIAAFCLLTCLASCLVVVGYRFIAVQGSKLAETTNLGAILMVLLTALFAIEKFAFANKYNEVEYNRWLDLRKMVANLSARVQELSRPDENAMTLFMNTCNGLYKQYRETVAAALKTMNEKLTVYNNSKSHALSLWDDYLGHAREFVESHFRTATDMFIGTICNKNSVAPESLNLSFTDIRPALEARMVKRYENASLRQKIEDFQFTAEVAGGLVLTDFKQLENEALRTAEMNAAHAAVHTYRAAN